MRELSAAEMMCVSGGFIPTLPPTVVHPDPGSGGGGSSGGGYSPPGTGSDPSGGGGHSGGNGGGGLSTQQKNGLARIQAELHIDLTAYAQMSPSLAQAISNATATYDWHFDFSADGSSCAYSATNSAQGKIHIGSAYENDPLAIVQQLSHELTHIDHRVWDNPATTTSQQYVKDYLTAEGYSTLANERVQHEILNASGGTINIGIASANPAATRPIYDAQYARVAANSYYAPDAAAVIGQAYGQYESAGGKSYTQIFMDNYHSGGGKQ